jgi:hypothetical protein
MEFNRIKANQEFSQYSQGRSTSGALKALPLGAWTVRKSTMRYKLGRLALFII